MNRYIITHTEITDSTPARVFVGKYLTFNNRGSHVVYVDGLPLMPGDEWREVLEGNDEVNHAYEIRFEDSPYTPTPPRAKNGKFLYVRYAYKK